MKNTVKIHLLVALCLVLQMCTKSLPEVDNTLATLPKISPDYTDLTIPVNIAPLNFCINEDGDKFMTNIYTSKGDNLITEGKVLDIDQKRWQSLLKSAQNDTVYAQVYVKRDGKWTAYAPIKYFVAEDIDQYISYRYIEPLYVNFEVLRICQRDISTFDEKDIYNNCGHLDVEGDRQCINCHSYQDYNRGGNMQMHIRVIYPGTLIAYNGDIRKVNLKVGESFSTGAYCSWHPTLPIIAYSINDTWQHFHSVDANKVEVQDAASGLIIYGIDNNEVSLISDSHTELETFPYWSPDGKNLYYISAKVPDMTYEEMANYRRNQYKDIKYNIYRRPFDAETRKFGPVDTVFMASDFGLSATFPRETPDGKYLLFTLGEYGTFHNFHHDADLYLMDLSNNKFRPLSEVNSNDTESYHSFSSNGRWIIFSTRRDNGSYTRLYLTHFDEHGRASKPFILPQRSPFADDLLFKSYNVPEFMAEPVSVTRKELTDAVGLPAIDAKYGGRAE